jgi:tetratricopeptide (TPR) repeat protein
MASSYHQLGMLAQDRGDLGEAARQYQRSLDINERLGNQAGLASGYHNLGVLAQDREDYDEAARQYQRSLDINERLGDQAGQALSYSQFAILETDRGGSTATAIAWHVRALVIRIHLGVPRAQTDLSRLSALRRELGVGPFTSLLAEAVGDTELTGTVTSWLDQWDSANDSAD